jgi:hypothetical protein
MRAADWKSACRRLIASDASGVVICFAKRSGPDLGHSRADLLDAAHVVSCSSSRTPSGASRVRHIVAEPAERVSQLEAEVAVLKENLG